MSSDPARIALLAGTLFAVSAVAGGVFYFVSKRPVTTVSTTRAAASPFAPRLELYRLPELRELRRVAAHVGMVFGATVSPDGKLAATASADGTVKVWNTETWTSTVTLGHDGRVGDVRFVDGGKSLVSAGGSFLKLWDVASGKLVRPVHADTVQITSVDVSGTSLTTAAFDGNARVWSLPDLKLTLTLPHSPNTGRLFDARFSPDGKWIATTGEDKQLKLWSAADGSRARTRP